MSPSTLVKARRVAQAEDWPWSSTGAHLAGSDTQYVKVEPALSRTGSFVDFLCGAPETDPAWASVLKAEGIGRPVGAKDWIEALERLHGMTLPPQKRGPKARMVEEKASETLNLL